MKLFARPSKKWSTASTPAFLSSPWTANISAPAQREILLWGMRRADIHDIKETEGIPIMAIPRRATYKPVHADSNMEDLLDRAINQNFVPVVDDQGSFIGIITRKSIIKYCYNEIKAAQKTAGEEIH